MSFKFTKPMQAKFLDALAKSSSVDRACEAINITWQLAYRQRTENAEFRARCRRGACYAAQRTSPLERSVTKACLGGSRNDLGRLRSRPCS